jgi:predicted site-specific integrase-resolvase
MWRDGRPPVPTEQLATGTVRVHPQKAETIDAVALYARVFSADQKSDLERQIGRLARYASREELTVVRSVSEIGSGLNGHRTKVMRLVADPSVHTIVVEHRGRLVRFGSEYIETAMSDSGRKVVVVDQTEMKDDLVQDNRAAKALAAAATQTPDDAA